MALGRREALTLGAVAVAAAAAGALAGALALQARSGAANLLAARFRDLSGNSRRLLDWQGRVLLCNFWATWCTPCREEIPLLVAARQHRLSSGFEVVGIGIDSVEKIVEFMATYRISYPILVADAAAIELMRGLGNRAGALPYTVVFDRSGSVVHRHLGAMTAQDIDQVLAGLFR